MSQESSSGPDPYVVPLSLKPARATSSSRIVIAIVLAALAGAAVVSICLMGLLLPAIDASRQVHSSNNAKMITLAMLSYHYANENFPPQFTVDEQGNPLHSWRTLLLPHMEKQSWYEQIDMDKPWDDPANAFLARQSFPIYESPRSPGTSRMTNYVAIAGQGHLFNGSEPVHASDIRDGTTNTLMIVEIANSTIPWAKPEDITLDDLNWEAEGASPGAANLVRETAVVGYADGAVEVLVAGEDRQWFIERLTIAGGETIEH